MAAAAAVFGVADAPAALAADPSVAPSDASRPAAKDDYYTRRAKALLAAEKSAAPKPHPLSAKYPGMDVVVCEAGCPEGGGPHVISVRRPMPTHVEREASMVTTSATDDGVVASPAAQDIAIACIAGCYGPSGTAMDGETEPPPSTSPAASLRPKRDRFSPIR